MNYIKAKLLAVSFFVSFISAVFFPESVAAIGITRVQGDVVRINPQASVDVGGLESDDAAFIFAEKQNFTLTRPISVDISQPGSYLSLGFPDNLTPTEIRPGSIVNSFLIHSDPLSPVMPPQPGIPYTGVITFQNPIIGLIVTTDTLCADKGAIDDLLGADGTSYPDCDHTKLRGLEPSSIETETTRDGLSLSGDSRTLVFSFRTREQIDQVRVITVPEPTTIAGIALAGSSLIALRRKQRLNK
jgi:hypothetical protein